MEFELISRLLGATAQARDDVVLGAGDDAAVLDVPAGRQLVASHDTMVEGTHFLPGTAAHDLGWKALAVNLSDLAAMGASPAWALLSLTMPRADNRFAEQFGAGFEALASQYRVTLAGGDTTSGPLAFGVSIFGLVSAGAALRRDTARPGDIVFVTGALGAGAAGLHCLDKSRADADTLLAAPGPAREQVIERYLRPQPRVGAGLALRGVASACMDLSDGLLADLGRLCSASGAGAEIEADRVPRATGLVELFGEAGALEYALGGGDDYELCFTVAQAQADTVAADLIRAGHDVTRVGRLVEGEGVRVLDARGKPLTPRWRGWEHFG